MESKRLIDLVHVGGNLGILVGLIFVGLQMQQDRELKRAELLYNNYSSIMDFDLALMGENPYHAIIKAAYNPEELTEEEAYINILAVDHTMLGWTRSAWMEELGLFTGGWQNSNLGWEMGTSVGRRFVESELQNYELPASFMDKIRTEIRVSPNFSDRLDRWRGAEVDNVD